MPLCEIHLPDRAVPRYWPDHLLPLYRYVPGLHPHPLRHPAGHSYEPAAHGRRLPAWDPTNWRGLVDWLSGVDQFNAFYFWEAHETWEGLWAAIPRHCGPARVLQGLIQVTAALLKIHLGSLSAATTLARRGVDTLVEAAARSPRFMGLDLPQASHDFHRYFRPLAERTLPRLDASVPVLRLHGAGDA